MQLKLHYVIFVRQYLYYIFARFRCVFRGFNARNCVGILLIFQLPYVALNYKLYPRPPTLKNVHVVTTRSGTKRVVWSAGGGTFTHGGTTNLIFSRQ